MNHRVSTWLSHTVTLSGDERLDVQIFNRDFVLVVDCIEASTFNGVLQLVYVSGRPKSASGWPLKFAPSRFGIRRGDGREGSGAVFAVLEACGIVPALAVSA